ncbi:hypothetical protein [Halomonas getboli]|uniref:hypothetical protein n=1 Tax=Halomonas getboli TaxID=2935862 RepID=UPI001FFF388A|nr:hypothetical protein [Halomonas getboli]MCK2184552.1 hypothetical protein [Halomonas getboli]
MKPTHLTRKLFAPALLAAAIAPLAFSASAGQGGPHGQPQPGGFHAEQREALFERAGIDAETRDELAEAEQQHRDALRELNQDYREQIDGILDDEQRAAIDEARQEMRQEHRAEMREARQERVDAVIDGWDLNDETRQSLDELRQSFMDNAKALQQRTFDSRDERRQAWLSLRDEHREALSELLTEEQIGELEQAMRPPHDGPGHRGERGHHGKPGPHGDAE